MTIVRELLERLAGTPVLRVEPEELSVLQAQARLVREVNTSVAGMLRIMRLGETVLFQEQTPRGELLVRRLDSLERAEALAADRMATYERMWDGCGCKVDYYGA